MDKQQLRKSLALAGRWITDIAQVKKVVPSGNCRLRPNHTNWRGAVGEYYPAEKRWDFFCPIWHTGQALKALCLADPLLKDPRILEAARLAAEFITGNQVSDPNDQDCGLILAYEDDPTRVNTSAILECLDGLFHYADLTHEEKWWKSAVAAALWVKNKAYLNGRGIFLDCYDPAKRTFVSARYGSEGRPLLDDGILCQVYQRTGDVECRRVFLETAERLLQDEEPPGNWINYAPCSKTNGSMHPRQAYWWGYPMKYAYEETKDARYLDCLVRSGDWYAQAQRRDGGLFRATYRDFTTGSFGLASSGVGCGLIIWQAVEELTGRSRYQDNIELGLQFLSSMQFVNPADSNLKGAILEKVMEPNGTDALPYYVRDLGTIFFIQAASRLLAGAS